MEIREKEDNKALLDYIINRIKIIRAQKGISQMELSLRSNLSQSFVANIESGKKQPSVLTLIKIARALEVNPQDFFPESVTAGSKEHIKEKIRKLLELL